MKKQLKLTQMQSDLKDLEDELEQRKQEALTAQKKYQEAQAITREKDEDEVQSIDIQSFNKLIAFSKSETRFLLSLNEPVQGF